MRPLRRICQKYLHRQVRDAHGRHALQFGHAQVLCQPLGQAEANSRWRETADATRKAWQAVLPSLRSEMAAIRRREIDYQRGRRNATNGPLDTLPDDPDDRGYPPCRTRPCAVYTDRVRTPGGGCGPDRLPSRRRSVTRY